MGPAGVDMGAIMEALQRRQSGGLGGGNPIPAATQLTGGGMSPMGSPQTQQPAPQGSPAPNMSQIPAQVAQGGGAGNEQLKATQQAQGPQFDPETKDLAKALMLKLLKGV